MEKQHIYGAAKQWLRNSDLESVYNACRLFSMTDNFLISTTTTHTKLYRRNPLPTNPYTTTITDGSARSGANKIIITVRIMRNPVASILHNYLHTLHTENVFRVLLLNILTRDETRDTGTDEKTARLYFGFFPQI